MDRAAYEKARALEKAGKGEEALRAFREAGAVDDVGRLLAAARRHREAGEVLFGSLGVRPSQAGQLEPSLKKRALSAAIWLAKGGEAQVSVELFVALGERQRAADTLQRAGDQIGAARVLAGERLEAAPSLLSQPRQGAVGGAATNLLAAQKLESGGKLDLAFEAYVQLRRNADAARVATRLGRGADAARLYADAGLPLEAAECYLEVGDTGKALDNLVRVPREDARYRAAALRAVKLASSLDALGIQLEHFVGAFVAKGPQDDAETEGFYLLARLYLRHESCSRASLRSRAPPRWSRRRCCRMPPTTTARRFPGCPTWAICRGWTRRGRWRLRRSCALPRWSRPRRAPRTGRHPEMRSRPARPSRAATGWRRRSGRAAWRWCSGHTTSNWTKTWP